jgi:lipopolysaccharide/colanic/teichoic acid biosynthesis glycosyltransferase
MHHNCEKLTGPCWAVAGDPRVTRLGRFLRHTHLDELPQLWNVVRGEMSLVGPRPERPEFIEKLEQVLPRYRHRLFVLPGVTGLAQVQLPADRDLPGVSRKITYDLFYIREMGPFLDLKILLCTLLAVLGVSFTVSGRILRVPRGRSVEGVDAVPREGNAVPARDRPLRLTEVWMEVPSVKTSPQA